MATAEPGILEGPVGRLLLATRAFAVAGLPPLMGYSLSVFTERQALSLLARAVDTVVGDRSLLQAFTDDDLLETLGAITDGYHHGFALFGGDGLDALSTMSPLLLPLEQAVMDSASHRWWWSPLGESQVVTEGAIGAMYDRDSMAYDTSDGWWTAPQTRSTVMTTRGPIAQGRSVAAVCSEDRAVESPGTAPFTIPQGLVREILSAQDFIDLVNEYPHPWEDTSGEWEAMTGARGPWTGPNWHAIADHYAGVHISVGAYLATAYRPLRAEGGFAHLAGWDPDGTVWFHQDYTPPARWGLPGASRT